MPDTGINNRLVVDETCLLRCDNEAGNSDRIHAGGQERPYRFADPDWLLARFFTDVRRWRDENCHA
jgi:hypothetical protein